MQKIECRIGDSVFLSSNQTSLDKWIQNFCHWIKFYTLFLSFWRIGFRHLSLYWNIYYGSDNFCFSNLKSSFLFHCVKKVSKYGVFSCWYFPVFGHLSFWSSFSNFCIFRQDSTSAAEKEHYCSLQLWKYTPVNAIFQIEITFK